MIFPLIILVPLDVQHFLTMEVEHVRFRPLPDTLRAGFISARKGSP